MATGTLGTVARDYPTRKFDITAQIGTPGILSAPAAIPFVAGGASYKLGTIPAGCGIIRISTIIGTVFNGTTPTVGIGTTSGGSDVVAQAGGPITTVGVNTLTIVAATAFRTADTTLWLTWASGAGNNAGQGLLVVEYVVAF